MNALLCELSRKINAESRPGRRLPDRFRRRARHLDPRDEPSFLNGPCAQRPAPKSASFRLLNSANYAKLHPRHSSMCEPTLHRGGKGGRSPEHCHRQPLRPPLTRNQGATCLQPVIIGKEDDERSAIHRPRVIDRRGQPKRGRRISLLWSAVNAVAFSRAAPSPQMIKGGSWVSKNPSCSLIALVIAREA